MRFFLLLEGFVAVISEAEYTSFRSVSFQAVLDLQETGHEHNI